MKIRSLAAERGQNEEVCAAAAARCTGQRRLSGERPSLWRLGREEVNGEIWTEGNDIQA